VSASQSNRLAVVLTGGGARAAYQVGVLRAVARHFPDTRFDIITGVSAGAINALFLASRQTALPETMAELSALWENLRIESVFRVDAVSLARHLITWGFRLVAGRSPLKPRVKGLIDTSPLRDLLGRVFPHDDRGVIVGVKESVRRCDPDAIAITTLNYTTGQTVTWVDGCEIETWARPLRRAVMTEFTVDHVMASAALPIIFPAVRLGDSWHGDGGIRLTAPLSPALHLGAERILAISTSHAKTFEEAGQHQTVGYPPPAQILGQLMSAVFLDVMDEDALRLQRSNEFLRDLPPEQRRRYRPVDLVIVRPSRDLSTLAARYEPLLPRGFRFLMRSLGTRETSRPDFLSLLMFEQNYLREMIAVGAADAEKRIEDIGRLLGVAAPAAGRPRAAAPTLKT
jgi:NTE family protein